MKGYKVVRPAREFSGKPEGNVLEWLSRRAERGEMNPVFMSAHALPILPGERIHGGGVLYSIGEETTPQEGCGPLLVYLTLERMAVELFKSRDRVALEVDYKPAPPEVQQLRAGYRTSPDDWTVAAHEGAGETWRKFLFWLGEDYAVKAVPTRVVPTEEVQAAARAAMAAWRRGARIGGAR